MLRPIAAALALSLAGCIAPEEPEPPKLVRPAVTSAPSSANFEAAPTPNRGLGRPAIDDVIRVAH